MFKEHLKTSGLHIVQVCGLGGWDGNIIGESRLMVAETRGDMVVVLVVVTV